MQFANCPAAKWLDEKAPKRCPRAYLSIRGAMRFGLHVTPPERDGALFPTGGHELPPSRVNSISTKLARRHPAGGRERRANIGRVAVSVLA